MKTESAKTSQAIKSELKKAFPKVKFSVKSSNFAGGNSVSISYTDAILRSKVEEITDKYQYGSFDGMNDIYNYDNSNDSIPQVKYVNVQRNMSNEVGAELLKEFQNDFKGAENLSMNDYHEDSRAYVSNIVYRMFIEREY